MGESLQQFVEQATGQSHLRVETDFGDGFVRLKTSEAERRQAAQDIRCTEDIVLEMLRNSRDAHAANIFVAISREGSKRMVTVIDDGCGIPQSMHELVFEPRVTSKLDTSHMDAWGLHGRGMALYSIYENAERAAVVSSFQNGGCAIRVETDLNKLSEKSDQSTFPSFLLAEGGSVNVRGPKNVLRTTCEFAIESRSQCSVYIGSPAEIAATMYAYGLATLSVIDRLFPKTDACVPLVKRLAQAGDPEEFEQCAFSLGIDISQRTSRRIIDGEISELDPVLDMITISEPNRPKRPNRASKNAGASRMVRLSDQDRESLARSVKGAFEDIAESYYLNKDVEPHIRVKRDAIAISIPIVKSE